MLKRLKTVIFLVLSLLSSGINNILFFLCKSLNLWLSGHTLGVSAQALQMKALVADYAVNIPDGQVHGADGDRRRQNSALQLPGLVPDTHADKMGHHSVKDAQAQADKPWGWDGHAHTAV